MTGAMPTFISGKPRGLPFGGRLGVFHVAVDQKTRELLRLRAAQLDAGDVELERVVRDFEADSASTNAGVAGALDSFARDMASMWPFADLDDAVYAAVQTAVMTGYWTGSTLLGRPDYDVEDEGGPDRVRQALLARTHCYATSDVDLLAGKTDYVDDWLGWVRSVIEIDSPILDDKLGTGGGAAVVAEVALTGLLIAIAEHETFTADPALPVDGANAETSVPAHHHRFDYVADPMQVTKEADGLVPFTQCTYPLCAQKRQWPRPPEHEHHYDLDQEVYMMLDGRTVYRCSFPGCPVLRLYGGSNAAYM